MPNIRRWCMTARIWRRWPTSRSRSGRGATRAGVGAFIGRDAGPWKSSACACLEAARADRLRSEEHTSELQSRRDLVCRLLLEKKKRCKLLRDLVAPAHDSGPDRR